MNAEAIESMPCLEYSALTLLWCRLFFYGCLPPANQMWGCHGWHVLSTWGCLFLGKTLAVIILEQRGRRTMPLWNLYLRMVSFAFAVGLFNLADMNCWGWPAFCERLWVDLCFLKSLEMSWVVLYLVSWVTYTCHPLLLNKKYYPLSKYGFKIWVLWEVLKKACKPICLVMLFLWG